MTHRPSHHCADCGLYALVGERSYRVQWWPFQIVISHKTCAAKPHRSPDMTASQQHLFNYVRKHPRTAYEVSEWLGVTLATASTRLNTLVDHGALRIKPGRSYTYEVAK